MKVGYYIRIIVSAILQIFVHTSSYLKKKNINLRKKKSLSRNNLKVKIEARDEKEVKINMSEP